MPFASSPLGAPRTANVAKFRAHYDKQEALHLARSGLSSPYSGALHFALLNAVALSVLLFCMHALVTAPEPYWRAGVWTIVLSFMFSNQVEYALHRFGMHDPESRSDHSPVHHRYFTATSMYLQDFDRNAHTLFFRVSFVFKGFFIVLPMIGMLLNFVFFPTCGYYFLLTGAAYYLQYEWLHLIYHAAPDSLLGRLPFVHILRTHHRVHHHQPLMRTHNFNITYPIMDMLWGTSYSGALPYSDELDHTPPPSTFEH